MPTRNVALTEHHQKVIADLVGSGRYLNASEVMREGLRLRGGAQYSRRRKAENSARRCSGWIC